MNKVVKVKDIVIGRGLPKICVPIVGETVDSIIEEADCLKKINPDVIEWRSDFFKNIYDIHRVEEVLQAITDTIYGIPLIFTFRSSREGGVREVSRKFYVELNEYVIQTKLVDIIDVELFNSENDIKQLVHEAHENNTMVIISNHEFNRTPPREEIISRLCMAQRFGADIPKIAVMPNSPEDVLTLLDATRIMKERYAKGPIITMSMSGMGIISRISGEVFGSDLTFGSVEKTSAPGQIPALELRKIVELMHENL